MTLILIVFIAATIGKLVFSLAVEISIESGGIYGEGLVGKPRLLNPVFADFNDVDRDITALIFSGLVKYDPSIQNFVPDLAQNIERSKDDLTYFVDLKKNALFHDETPVTASDVYFTYREVIQDPGFKNPLLRQAFQDVKIEKIDEDTVSFTLPEKNSFFISFLTVGILPANILRGTPIAEIEKHPFNKNPVGSGPFQFSQTQGAIGVNTESLTLVRFEKYFGEKPALKSMRFSFFETWEDLIEEQNSLSGIPKISSHEIKEKISGKRFALSSYRLPHYVAVFFQLERPLISEKRFRQALMKSVEKNKLQELLKGEVAPIDTLFSNLLPNLWIHQYDVKIAAQTLKDLGYTKGEDGFLRNSKDQVPTLTLLARKIQNSPQDKEIENVTNFLRNQWQAIGVRINVQREEADNFAALLKKREYDMVIIGQSLGYNNDSFSFWHSSKRGENGLNLSQLRSFRVDSILEDLRGIFDGERKRKRLNDLELALSDEMPALFLYTPSYGFALDKKIEGIAFPPMLALPSDRFETLAK